MSGSMTERTPGVWRLRVVTGYDPSTGNPHQVSRTVRGTKRQAGVELAKFVTEVSQGTAPMSGKMTVGEYLDRWIDHVRPSLAPDTVRNYESRTKRFKAELGNVRLDRLKAHQIDVMYGRWVEGGMNPSTVRAYHAVLSTALRRAVKWDLVPRAVTSFVTLPRAGQEARRVFSPQDIVTLIAAAKDYDPVLAAAIEIASLTGVRRGELLGLQWKDWRSNGLHIERAIKRGGNGQVPVVGPTKTHQTRIVPLNEPLRAALNGHRTRVDGWAADAKVGVGEHAFIISREPDGSAPMSPDVLTARFQRLTAKTHLPGRFHDLRHTAATMLVANGVDTRQVANLLGHESPVTTLRTYSHGTDEKGQEASDLLGKLVTGTEP